MLEFCEQLTLAPALLEQQHLHGLRGHGFSDRDILSIILAGAYRNYIVRVADALGVELNPQEEYAPELIRAFGVDETQARTTLYSDRLTKEAEGARGRADAEKAKRAPLPAPPRVPFPVSDGVCWIDTTPPTEMLEDVRRLEQELARAAEVAPPTHLARAFALRPDALGATLEYLRLVGLGGSGLGRQAEGLIGLTVAATLWAPYPGAHHAQRLLAEVATPEQVQALVRAPAAAPLEGREGELVRFCGQLARQPSTMTRADVEALRAVGFQDRAILTIVAAASLEDFVCRVATAVGLQPEVETLSAAALEPFGLTASAPA